MTPQELEAIRKALAGIQKRLDQIASGKLVARTVVTPSVGSSYSIELFWEEVK